MNNYDDEEEEVQVPLPPHKVRYNEMPSNAFRAVVESKIAFLNPWLKRFILID